MQKSDFYFDLPERLIAQTPLLDRSSSRLMALDKYTGAVEHKKFSDIVGYLGQGDCLVLNNTKVIPARVIGHKEGLLGKVEVLLLRRIDKDIWETLAKPGKRARAGDKIIFDTHLSCEVLDVLDDGNRVVKFNYDGVFEEALDKIGQMPLPPYIKGEVADKGRYQTIYAKIEGSAAAPTAGLHFTEGLLSVLKQKGVNIAYLTLHIGLGTFRPVKADNILEHKMHSEFYSVDKECAELINSSKSNGKKIIAVGTTSCRTLESCAGADGFIKPGSGNTDIFIYPGYKFKIVDSLITNFHLPESTLIMLISALCGRENVLNAYHEAIAQEYRFFSFGDAMFIK
ncbi:MAG: tRNA preQ1(34) S-adenosylmethionine ribosyltransferase-isomerase QueA [Clostridiales bacterium]|nr:tRNA preQ1(34) S-adenosylmethionine ribosyltransferase-isomerase QueA [Clostridiales bacterium]